MANINEQLKEIAAKIDGKQSEVVTDEPIESIDGDDGNVDTAAINPDTDGGNATVDENHSHSDGDDIKTFSQLATAIDVTPEYLYGMEIGMGDNEDAVPLGKLKDLYQEGIRERTALQEQLTAQTEQLSSAQLSADANNQISQEMQYAQADLIQLNQQFARIDWQQYEQDDPGAAALARQKFQEAGSGANQRYQMAEQQQKQQSYESLQQAAAKLTELIPTWSNSEVRATGVAKVKNVMKEAGYSQGDIANVRDYRAISLLNELIGYREQAKAADAAVKTVRKAPNVLTGRGRFQAKKEDKTQVAVGRAKASGARKDEEAAVKAVLGLK